MGLKEVQALTAQLYVDPLLRETFFRDRAAVAARFGISGEDEESLRLLSEEQVARFAASLQRKRLAEVRNLLPLSAKALGEALPELFFAFAERGAPRGIARHAVDAIGFAEHLATRASIAEWMVELCRYEATHLVAQRANRCLLVRRFRFDLRAVGQQFAQKQEILPPPKRTIAMAWIRLSCRAPLRRIAVPLVAAP